MPVPSDVEAQAAALAAPFAAADVKWRPGPTKGNRALALAYVNARAVMSRLDQVLGVAGWQDDFEPLPDGCVLCRLRVKLGGEWLLKADVGAPSKQKDGGDRTKAAFSGALKRAALKYGIGRYLAELPAQWVDYDPARKCLAGKPVLPDWALPRGDGSGRVSPSPPAAASPQPASSRAKATRPLPANGVELQQRLQDYDARLTADGLCQGGDLVLYVVNAGVERGYAGDLTTWDGPAIAWAVDEARKYQAVKRRPIATKGQA